jgi:hypothetical protein
MSEAEKKGSPWPWILVPVAAISLFFVLRQCRQNLPPHEQATPEAAVPATPATPAAAVPPPVEPEAPPPAAEPPAQ